MTPQEIGEVVALAAAGDQYMSSERMTGERVALWVYAIQSEAPEMTLAEARDTIAHYYARVGKSLQVDELISLWEQRSGKAQRAVEIARDVRVARSLGFVSRDWHEKRALPREALAKLAEYREAQKLEREQVESSYMLGTTNASPLALDVGRQVDG
ncbi:hypothetical protein G7068_11895 [Leucobacter viscericola]|uniref:Uncharacterized protein n=1 Tax=Leucobacter viscericola TaxID=2714935 RepID=A0A6G7XHH0_9MICO|nr:hypothetical protein [Leucobacter viscericola]QIK63811.1 hypothetical protein G7068_11895 [Leucobacter viscericola]